MYRKLSGRWIVSFIVSRSLFIPPFDGETNGSGIPEAFVFVWQSTDDRTWLFCTRRERSDVARLWTSDFNEDEEDDSYWNCQMNHKTFLIDLAAHLSDVICAEISGNHLNWSYRSHSHKPQLRSAGITAKNDFLLISISKHSWIKMHLLDKSSDLRYYVLFSENIIFFFA